MNILVADKLSGQAIKDLGKFGKVIFAPQLGADDLPAHIQDAEVLVVRSTKVNAETIAAGSLLALIIRAGAGVNTIDLEAAGKRGIHVANCPGKNTDAVAELAIGLLLAADRRLVNASNDLRAGKWRKKLYGDARGVKGRTLGIVGLGSIGMAVAERARGLKMNVAAWSRSLTPQKAEELGIEYCRTPERLAEISDAVSIHLASSAETKHLIGAKFFAAMKDNSILVNAARGEVVDTAALKNAVAEKKLRVAADVFEDEPAGGEAEFADTELAAMITATPHIGASTDQAAEAIAAEVVNIVESYNCSGKPLNTVNHSAKSDAVNTLVVRHYNKVGVLAGILDHLRAEGINVEEMENLIFSGGKAACCMLKVDSTPGAETVREIAGAENIIKVMLK